MLGTTAEAAAPADERSLSALVKAYFAEGDREKRWTAKTRSELDAIYKLMLEILGADKPVASITRKDASYLKEMLAKLPSNKNKDRRFRTKSVLELAGMKIPEEDLLSVSSANKALIRVSSLFKYGVQHGWISNNPAEGMTFRKKKRDDEEREQYRQGSADTGGRCDHRAARLRPVPVHEEGASNGRLHRSPAERTVSA